MQEYVRYPLVMKHPSHRPAVIRHTVAMSNGGQELAQAFAARGVVGQGPPQPAPEMYPDVIVQNDDDEAYYISRGYKPAGGADPAGARTIQAAPLPANYRPQEWPRAVGERIMGDPNAPTGDPNEYPKYLAAFDLMVYSRDEEDALRIGYESRQPDPGDEQLKSTIRRVRDTSKAKKSYPPANAERVELLKMCRDLGIKHFAGWPVEKLRRLVEEATAPKAEDAA